MILRPSQKKTTEKYSKQKNKNLSSMAADNSIFFLPSFLAVVLLVTSHWPAGHAALAPRNSHFQPVTLYCSCVLQETGKEYLLFFCFPSNFGSCEIIPSQSRKEIVVIVGKLGNETPARQKIFGSGASAFP